MRLIYGIKWFITFSALNYSPSGYVFIKKKKKRKPKKNAVFIFRSTHGNKWSRVEIINRIKALYLKKKKNKIK